MLWGGQDSSEQLYNHDQRWTVRKMCKFTDSLVDKDRVRERSDSQVRVGVHIQVHVSCQRVAELLHSWLAVQNLKQQKHTLKPTIITLL